MIPLTVYMVSQELSIRKSKAVRRVYVFPDSNGLPAAFDDRLKKAFPGCEELVVI